MRFGVCTSPENAAIIAAAGFDYIEFTVAGHLRPYAHEAVVLRELEARLVQTGIGPEVFNGLLPREMKVVGPTANLTAIAQYLDEAFYRASRLGGEVVVFDSSDSRRVLDGFPRAVAENQLVEFLLRAGDLAGRNNLRIAIEPLNTSECNILNSVAEAQAMANRVNHPSIMVLSDLFHVSFDHQSYDETIAAGSSLGHVHVAGRRGRMAPNAQDIDYLGVYFRDLKLAGYDGRVSIEAGWSDIALEAADSLSSMRQAWKMSAFSS